MTRPTIGFKPVPVEGPPYQKQAVWDGQPQRPPKKGELYLSGAIVVAYRAKNDLDTAYFIARPL